MDTLGECFWTARDLRARTPEEVGEHLRSIVLRGTVSMGEARRAVAVEPLVDAALIPLPTAVTVPVWRVVASTVLIQALACTAAILIYILYFSKIAS